jgi:hypothetical protein
MQEDGLLHGVRLGKVQAQVGRVVLDGDAQFVREAVELGLDGGLDDGGRHAADALANQQAFEGRLHALGVPAPEGSNRRVDGLVVARFGLAAQRGELLGEAERFDGVGVRGDIALQLHRVHEAR